MSGTPRTKESLTFRIDAALKDRMEGVISRLPYTPTATSVIERGLVLALDEMERMIAVLEKQS